MSEWTELTAWFESVATVASVESHSAVYRRIRALIEADPILRESVLGAINTLAVLVREVKR